MYIVFIHFNKPYFFKSNTMFVSNKQKVRGFITSFETGLYALRDILVLPNINRQAAYCKMYVFNSFF